MSKNILLITTDQQSATMMSCTGNPNLHTPNIDNLANNGIRFEKSYAAQPLCIPQRNSWYTGLMPHEHGLTFNLPKKEVAASSTMGSIFKDANYMTGYSGKWHVNIAENDVAKHGFEWTSNLRCNGADENIVGDFKRFLVKKEDGPFLFSASFNNPHNICESASGLAAADGHPVLFENLDQLPDLPDNFDIPENEPSVLREIQDMYRGMNYPTQNWDETRWRMHRWFYCRMTELVDAHIGNLMKVLDEQGLSDDTLVVFTSDHGDGNAHHHWNQKQVLYDESAQVPFIISMPNSGLNLIEGRQLVNTGIDLIPTLCGLAEISCPDYLKGVDWSGVTNDSINSMQRDHLVVETEFGTFGKPADCLGRCVRTPKYKYMVYSRGENREFFVDMEKDPGEMVNLAKDESSQQELQNHRDLLVNYIKESKDIFPIELVSNKTC